MARVASISRNRGGVCLRDLLYYQQRAQAEAANGEAQEEDALIRPPAQKLLLAVGLVTVWGIGDIAQAASNRPAETGFVVSPAYQNVSIGESQAQAHYEVTLSNSTGSDQAFKLSTVDFGSLNDSGGVAFLGSSTSSFAKKYGLSNWMKLDADTVTVPAGKDVQIGVSVLNYDTLTAGGHYGAILATAQTAPNGPAVQPRVGVFEVLSSLILLIKQGGAPPLLTIISQSTNGGLWQIANSVTDRFQNSGNVHVTPRGVIEVKDPLGRVVERGSINVDSGIILPQMYRKYVTHLYTMARVWVPGSYTVKLAYRYDGTTDTNVFISSYWFCGPVGLGILAGLVLILALITVGLWMWRRRLKKQS